MKKIFMPLALCLLSNLTHADEAITQCRPGEHKAMLAYESSDENVISFGNIFVCTPVGLNTEAGMRELRRDLQAIHKNAVLVSVIPLQS